MLRECIDDLFILLYILSLNCSGLPFSHGNLIENKGLAVGEEIWKETLPLQMGSRLNQLQGLKSHTWYEVRISYPASIPASFTIRLKRGNSELGLNWQRKLLDTEKLIFKSDDLDLLTNQGGMHDLVTVEPEGVVAIPNGQEREYVIYNIVCDELSLGIPHKAWWVVILVLLCLGLAFVIPHLFFLRIGYKQIKAHKHLIR
ncbi:unnamed protein product [Ilex paraguariensis]|uniref:Uncharacterized protein n=1 Tax=Ilex paraguariensis TaxID=185542 RepID=A0ABC8SZQ6_9AQUA